MEKSKQVKASGCKDEIDMISNLPDPILLLILSRIPSTEEVIRTSILSTRWKYLWTSVPSIDIDYTRGVNPLKEFKTHKFNEFVYWVLANKSLNLDSFRLICPVFHNMSTIMRWLHIAVTKNVKQLHLLLFPREKFDMPHFLATCNSVEVLKLCLFGRPLSFPSCTGFPSLRVLELNYVELTSFGLFNDDSVKHFFKSCLLLEELSLIDCCTDNLDVLHISCPKLKRLTMTYPKRTFSDEVDSDSVMCDRLEISCPNMVYLKLIGEVGGRLSLESLDSLKEAEIRPEELYWEDLDNPLVGGFGGLSHVESLSISLYCVTMCYCPPNDVPVSLPNLKTLEITTGAFAMDVLIPFLICFPDLESLHLIITYPQVHKLEDWKLDDDETLRVLTRRLKLVEFHCFDGEEPKLVVARSLLEHGSALEHMDFLWFKEAEYHEKSIEAMKEVSKFHKASSTVKVRSVIESCHSLDTRNRLP